VASSKTIGNGESNSSFVDSSENNQVSSWTAKFTASDDIAIT